MNPGVTEDDVNKFRTRLTRIGDCVVVVGDFLAGEGARAHQRPRQGDSICLRIGRAGEPQDRQHGRGAP